MLKEYRILMVEDFPSDAIMAEMELNRSLQNFRTLVVDSENDYLKALDTFAPDLIISDYKLPSFDGLSALKIAQKKIPLTPVIILTGSMNEDTAVECMRAGAADYVIKEHIKRLGPAVISALEQKDIKLENLKKTEQLISSEKMYHLMFVNNPEPMFIYDSATLAFLEVNHAAIRLYGYSEQEFLDMTIKDIRPAEDVSKLLEFLKMPRESFYPTQPWRHLKKNGDMIIVEITSHGIKYNDRPARHVLIKDITQQKKAEEALIYNEKKYHALIENSFDAILLTSPDGVIYEGNPAACNMFGYRLDEFPLLLRENLVDTSDPRFSVLIEERKKAGKARGELNFIRKDGSIFTVEITSAIFEDSNKQLKSSMIIRDMTERKIAEEELRQSEERFRSLFQENLSVMLLLEPVTGNIVDVNEAAVKYYGWTREQLLQMKIHDINTMDHGPWYDFINSATIKQSQYELIHRRADGNQCDVEVFSSAIRIKGEDFLHLIIHDISEKKRLINELIDAKRKSEESDKLKTAFLHNISHEIRTPLNAIVGFSSILVNPEVPANKRKEFIEIINVSNDQLLSIISGILALSTLEAGQEHLEEKEANLNDILHQVYKQFQITHRSPDISFSYYTALHDDTANILTDPVKLMQILVNLVGNALKFTVRGIVRFGYRLSADQISLCVEDTGIGIPEDMHELIFERFRQVDNSATRKYGGAGLGLALSKGYIEMMGGLIELKSEPGKGSQFTFTIPYKPLIQPGLINDSGLQEIKLPPGKTILVAEDEINNFLLIREMLSALNVKVIHAKNGLEALRLCEKDNLPDLVLMDIKMPVMDGIEAIMKIKELRPGLPIIALTAYVLETEKNRILQSGCDDYLEKPVNNRVLKQILSRYLKSHKGREK